MKQYESKPLTSDGLPERVHRQRRRPSTELRCVTRARHSALWSAIEGQQQEQETDALSQFRLWSTATRRMNDINRAAVRMVGRKPRQ